MIRIINHSGSEQLGLWLTFGAITTNKRSCPLIWERQPPQINIWRMRHRNNYKIMSCQKRKEKIKIKLMFIQNSNKKWKPYAHPNLDVPLQNWISTWHFGGRANPQTSNKASHINFEHRSLTTKITGIKVYYTARRDPSIRMKEIFWIYSKRYSGYI